MIQLVSRDAQLFLHTAPHTSQDSTVREVRTCLHVKNPAQHIQLEYANCEIEDRLCPRRCHWNGCQAILNSIYALKQHVRQHQSEVEPIGPAMVSTLCGMSPEELAANMHFLDGIMPMETMSYGVRTVQSTSTP
jgi:hypothetical protein